jgi:hypothetical protein
MTIFTFKNEQSQGPHSIEEINAQLAEGTLQPTDLAWMGSWQAWQAVSALPGVRAPAVPPPLPANVQTASDLPGSCNPALPSPLPPNGQTASAPPGVRAPTSRLPLPGASNARIASWIIVYGVILFIATIVVGISGYQSRNWVPELLHASFMWLSLGSLFALIAGLVHPKIYSRVLGRYAKRETITQIFFAGMLLFCVVGFYTESDAAMALSAVKADPKLLPNTTVTMEEVSILSQATGKMLKWPKGARLETVAIGKGYVDIRAEKQSARIPISATDVVRRITLRLAQIQAHERNDRAIVSADERRKSEQEQIEEQKATITRLASEEAEAREKKLADERNTLAQVAQAAISDFAVSRDYRSRQLFEQAIREQAMLRPEPALESAELTNLRSKLSEAMSDFETTYGVSFDGAILLERETNSVKDLSNPNIGKSGAFVVTDDPSATLQSLDEQAAFEYGQTLAHDTFDKAEIEAPANGKNDIRESFPKEMDTVNVSRITRDTLALSVDRSVLLRFFNGWRFGSAQARGTIKPEQHTLTKLKWRQDTEVPEAWSHEATTESESLQSKGLEGQTGPPDLRATTRDDMGPLVLSRSNPSATLPRAPNGDTASEGQQFVRFMKPRYGCSMLVPKDVFPNSPQSPDNEHATFVSSDGRTELYLIVDKNEQNRNLSAVYNEWIAERTERHPAKTVQYKVLRSNWFVASGDDNGRGFYAKGVAKHGKFIFMVLEYDENACPIGQDMLTTMSRDFDGGSGSTNFNQPKVDQD